MNRHPADDLFPDEPWEAEISQMLSGLDPIEPPPGFIDQAIDHRPLFAGRTLVAMMAAATAMFGVSVGLGAFGQPRLVPDLSALTSGVAIQSGAPVSVYREPGVVELDELPGGERIDLGGREAWVDAENSVVVVANDASVVTMVGVTPEEAEALLNDIDEGPGGLTGVLNQITSGVGFPDLG